MKSLQDYGNDAVLRIRELLEVLNINAFGNLSNSITFEVLENDNFDELIIKADSYFTNALLGRGANTSNSGGLLEGIQAWVKLGKYGIDPSDKGIAYAITKKIAKEGSYKFRNQEEAEKNKNALNELLDIFVNDLQQGYAKTEIANVVERIKLEIRK